MPWGRGSSESKSETESGASAPAEETPATDDSRATWSLPRVKVKGPMMSEDDPPGTP